MCDEYVEEYKYLRCGCKVLTTLRYEKCTDGERSGEICEFTYIMYDVEAERDGLCPTCMLTELVG